MGAFLDYKKHGFGKIIYKNETTYEGEWQNDLYHGYGTLKEIIGESYKGWFINGKKDTTIPAESGQDHKHEETDKQDEDCTKDATCGKRRGKLTKPDGSSFNG